MNEISCSFVNCVHIWSTYSVKIHLAANEIIFRVIRGYNGTFHIFVISNLYTYLATIGSSICAINSWNSFPIAFDLLHNIPTIKNFHVIGYQKGKILFANYIGIELFEWGCIHVFGKKWKITDPEHDKKQQNDMHPAKDQISQGICLVPTSETQGFDSWLTSLI